MRKLVSLLLSFGFAITLLRAETLDVNALKQAQRWSDEQIAFGPLSIETAKQAIINWAGRQNLVIDLAPYEDIEWDTFLIHSTISRLGVEGITIPYGYDYSETSCFFKTNYVFKVQDPNPDRKYSGYVYVDSWTGRITGINRVELISTDFVRTVKEKGMNVKDMISPQQAKTLAPQYLADYFPQVAQIVSNKLEMVDPLPTPDGQSWTMFDPHICVGFANIPQATGEPIVWVSIGLDCFTGQLETIDCGYYDVLEVSLQPDVSEETAVETALSFLYGLGAEHLEIERVGISLPFRESPNGRQRIAYDIFLGNTMARDDAPLEVKRLLGDYYFPHKLFVRVDIHTGEVLLVADRKAMCARAEHPSNPKLFIDGREQKAKILCKDDYAGILAEDLKKLGFSLGSKNGKAMLRWKGEVIPLEENKILKENGGTYINVEALNKFKGLKVIYAKRLKTIDILKLNDKAWQKGKKLLKERKARIFNPIIGSGLMLCSISYLGLKFLRILK